MLRARPFLSCLGALLLLSCLAPAAAVTSLQRHREQHLHIYRDGGSASTSQAITAEAASSDPDETALVRSVVALPATKASVDRGEGHQQKDFANQTGQGPKPADFFDGFSAGESTYNEALDRGQGPPEAGWNPDVQSPVSGTRAGGDWFEESESAGGDDVWQTYPALQGSWSETSSGQWVQQPNPGYNEEQTPMDGNPLAMKKGIKGIDPAWFDNSVVQPDRFNRYPAPNANSPEFYAGWEDRRFNTSFLKCSEPGCVAEASLDLFSATEEEAGRCRMSVFVEHHSGGIAWVKANDASIILDCNPPQFCDPVTETRPTYACLLDLDLERLVQETGRLTLEAKLNDQASPTCASDGDLLRLQPVVSCYVEARSTPTPRQVNATERTS